MSGGSVADIIKYIKYNVGELSNQERMDILQMIVNSSIDDNKIQTKGDGTQIKFRDMPKDLIYRIHTYIQNKLSSKLNELQYFPDYVNEANNKHNENDNDSKE